MPACSLAAKVPPGSPIQGKVNMVFSGSMVTVGSAYAVVTSTGMNTEMGVISRGVAAAKAEVDHRGKLCGRHFPTSGGLVRSRREKERKKERKKERRKERERERDRKNE